MNLDYNEGPPEWAHGSVVIYPNGQKVRLCKGFNNVSWHYTPGPPRRREAVLATRAKYGD